VRRNLSFFSLKKTSRFSLKEAKNNKETIDSQIYVLDSKSMNLLTNIMMVGIAISDPELKHKEANSEVDRHCQGYSA
jgi:hypothetical protein